MLKGCFLSFGKVLNFKGIQEVSILYSSRDVFSDRIRTRFCSVCSTRTGLNPLFIKGCFLRVSYYNELTQGEQDSSQSFIHQGMFSQVYLAGCNQEIEPMGSQSFIHQGMFSQGD